MFDPLLTGSRQNNEYEQKMTTTPAPPSGLMHGAAGSLSSVAALALLYPLDQLRMLQQLGLAPRGCSDEQLRGRVGDRLGALVELVQREGVRGMYRGLTPSLFTLAISNFLFYYTFHSLKRVADQLRTSKNRFSASVVTREASLQRGTVENLVTSAVAGMINVLLTNPLWLAATLMKGGLKKQDSHPHRTSPLLPNQPPPSLPPPRLQQQSNPPTSQYLASIYHVDAGAPSEDEESADAICDATAVATYLDSLYSATSAHTLCAANQRGLPKDRNDAVTSPPVSYITGLYGAASSTVSKSGADDFGSSTGGEPRGRGQDDAAAACKKGALSSIDGSSVAGVSGLIFLLLRIRKEKGVAHLWKGTVASLVLVSNPIIQFAVYEGLKRIMLMRHRGALLQSGSSRRRQRASAPYSLSAAEGFVLGAVSKAVATCATYPLQVAQARLRAAPSTQHHPSVANDDEVADGAVKEPQVQRVDAAKTTTVACLTSIYHSGGIAALFEGLETKLTQSVATSAFMFASYESILGIVSKAG
jgi:hypothetical protein